MGRLDGKVAVITGTGNGQGRTAALRFAAEGAAVVGCDINEQTAAETLKLVRDAGGRMECLYPLDLGVEDEAIRLMTHAEETFGKIDILYNNAMGMMAGFVLQMKLEAFEFTMRNTLTLGWLATKHAAPHMNDGGSVIFIASQGAWPQGGGIPGNVPFAWSYCVAKAGVVRLASILAIELSPRKIRVNTISPGPILTPISSALFSSEDAVLYRGHVDQALIHRIGVPDDIVNAALYLASDESSFMTGSHMVIDGGIMGSLGGGQPDPELRERFLRDLPHYFNHDGEEYREPVGPEAQSA